MLSDETAPGGRFEVVQNEGVRRRGAGGEWYQFRGGGSSLGGARGRSSVSDGSGRVKA